MNNFNELTRNVRSLLNNSLSKLNDERTGLPALSEPLVVANRLRSYGDDYFKAGHTYTLAMHIAYHLETICWDSVACGADNCESSEDELWWEERTKKLAAYIMVDALNAVWRGPETSSNPLTIVETMMQLEAHKKVLEAVVGIWSIHEIISYDSCIDILNGRERRRQEREAKLARIPSSVSVVKDGKVFYAISFNHKNMPIGKLKLEGSNRKQARAEAEAWSVQLANEHATGSSKSFIRVTMN